MIGFAWRFLIILSLNFHFVSQVWGDKGAYIRVLETQLRWLSTIYHLSVSPLMGSKPHTPLLPSPQDPARSLHLHIASIEASQPLAWRVGSSACASGCLGRGHGSNHLQPEPAAPRAFNRWLYWREFLAHPWSSYWVSWKRLQFFLGITCLPWVG